MDELVQRQMITLEGAYNVRDLGGFKCSGGNISKWKRFIRSDGLDNLTESDIKKLVDYGVKINIDLRSDEECEGWKDNLCDISEVQYEHIHLLKGLKSYPESLGGLYIESLKTCTKYFYKVFKIMIENEDKEILFHCSAGKDRTGMIAAMLLLLIGVDTKDIIENYTLSMNNLNSIIDKFSYENDESLKEFLGAEAESINTFLNYLRNEFNGTEGYLKFIGFNEKDIEILKLSFLEKEN